MEKLKLSALAAMTLVAGSMAQAEARCTNPSESQASSLFSQLDGSHQEMYNAMDCDGKNMAMQMAMQSCAGKNACKGQNSCKTQQNSCAGQGGCKGVSPGPFKDKNKAVDVAQMMMDKRSQTMGS